MLYVVLHQSIDYRCVDSTDSLVSIFSLPPYLPSLHLSDRARHVCAVGFNVHIKHTFNVSLISSIGMGCVEGKSRERSHGRRLVRLDATRYLARASAPMPGVGRRLVYPFFMLSLIRVRASECRLPSRPKHQHAIAVNHSPPS